MNLVAADVRRLWLNSAFRTPHAHLQSEPPHVGCYERTGSEARLSRKATYKFEPPRCHLISGSGCTTYPRPETVALFFPVDWLHVALVVDNRFMIHPSYLSYERPSPGGA